MSLVKSSDMSNSNAESHFMEQFFADIEQVKKHIGVITESTAHVADINQRVLLAANSEKEQGLSDELKPVLNNANKKAHVAKQILQKLREDTERIKTSKDGKPSEIRIRENLVNTVTRKFVDVMKLYQNSQQKYKQDIKKKVTRQVQIVKEDVTTEEVDAVMKSGGTSTLFQSAILQGDASDSISNAFMNAKDKYQDVLTLEASVAELHQMFLDFALLTEQQGEMLDQIEFQVKSAGDYVDEGNVTLVAAVELQKSLRYKQCCCCVILLIIVGVIVGVVYAYSKKSGA